MRNYKKETMTSKERVLATMNHQVTDRVPINYLSNPGIDLKLKKHFGLKANQSEELMDILGVDFRGIGVNYTGPSLHKPIENRRVDPQWGYVTREVDYGKGT